MAQQPRLIPPSSVRGAPIERARLREMKMKENVKMVEPGTGAKAKGKTQGSIKGDLFLMPWNTSFLLLIFPCPLLCALMKKRGPVPLCRAQNANVRLAPMWDLRQFAKKKLKASESGRRFKANREGQKTGS